MDDKPDETRQRAREWLNTAEGDQVLLALGRFLSALEREAQASTVEARDAAQEAALKAAANMDTASGAIALRRRRMVVAARGEPPGTAADERDFDTLTHAKKRNSRRGRAALRHAAGRYLLDDAPTLTVNFVLWLTGQARSANKGFKGVLEHEPVSGTDPDGGAAHSLREETIHAVGYTAGQKCKGARLPSTLWVLAAKAHNDKVPKLLAEGLKVKRVTPGTVKDWCLREGEGREQFELTRERGRKDRERGRCDRKSMLT